MYDEVMQLISLAKNDEMYFKRIEDLKQQMLELAQVKEIAKTLDEADKHMAMARQRAAEIIADAEAEAKVIKSNADLVVTEAKATLAKAKEKKAANDKTELDLAELIKQTQSKQAEMEESIKEHRTLTALRSEEMDKANKARTTFESKMKQVREIINA